MAAGAQAATVVVQVSGVSPGGGRLYVQLCQSSLDPAGCGHAEVLDGRTAVAQAVFPGLAPGLYAAAAFQDINGNGTLDRSAHGLPLEPYGFSNGAGRTSAPRFDRAAVAVGGDTLIPVQLQTIRSRQ